MTTPEPLLLTATQAAQRLGCGRTFLYELIARGELTKVSLGRATRIPESSVRDFVARRTAVAIAQHQAALAVRELYAMRNRRQARR
jgi:excisionase family DNA binding protein